MYNTCTLIGHLTLGLVELQDLATGQPGDCQAHHVSANFEKKLHESVKNLNSQNIMLNLQKMPFREDS